MLDDAKLAQARQETLDLVRDVNEKLVQQFHTAIDAEDIRAHQNFLFYVMTPTRQSDVEAFMRRGSIKYAHNVEKHIDDKMEMLPPLTELAGKRVNAAGESPVREAL